MFSHATLFCLLSILSSRNFRQEKLCIGAVYYLTYSCNLPSGIKATQWHKPLDFQTGLNNVKMHIAFSNHVTLIFQCSTHQLTCSYWFVGHLGAAESSSEHNIDILSPIKLSQRTWFANSCFFYTSSRNGATWAFIWCCVKSNVFSISTLFYSNSWCKYLALQLLNVPLCSPASCCVSRSFHARR